MALKSTIYKVSLQLSDLNRELYQSYALNVALHPSETLERMLMRLLAFSLYANEDLRFTKGLSTDDEPDIWLKSLSDEIELWVDLGLPDLKRIRKAAGRSKQVVIFAYGGQKVSPWFEGVAKDLDKLTHATVIKIDMSGIEALVSNVERTMEMSVIVQDQVISVTLGDSFSEVQFDYLYATE